MTQGASQLGITEALDASGVGIIPNSFAARDWQIVRWVSRMGAVTMAQLATRFGLGRTAAYRRIAECRAAGLVERVETMHGQPALIRATRRGLRFAAVALRPAQIRPELVGHWIACADVGLLLEREFGERAVRSEREIRRLEVEHGRPLASAVLRERPDGSDMRHRPDLAVWDRENVLAIEVELTPKAPQRLESIVRAWRRARWIVGTRYYAATPLVAAGVERAIARTHAEGRVEVYALHSVPSGARFCEREGDAI
jgi:DNA-binding Lrp family transcriptional regulator